MKTITIRSEKQAFDLLEKAVNSELGPQPFELKFENWPVLTIRFEGEGYDSTITSDIAEAVVEVQRAVNRAYARAVHKTSNSRSLTNLERQDIQFKAKVEPGSSIIKIDLGDFAEKLATTVAQTMTPTFLAITIVGLAITGASLVAYKAFLKKNSDDKQIDVEARTKIALSQEETRRLDLMAKATARVPTLAHANEDFDLARIEILRAAGDAATVTVNSLVMDRETARAIGNTPRTQSLEIQLNGNYHILATDVSRPDEVRFKVQRASDGIVFYAGFKDHSLEQGQIALLQAAEWSRTQVYLSINARSLRGEITSATVIEVKIQPV